MKKPLPKLKFVVYKKTLPLPGTTHDFMYREHQLTDDDRQIVGFVVIQLLDWDGTTHEVVKHDCAHGKYHVHRYYEGPHSKVIALDDPISNELFLAAKRDVLENWQTYRERYIQKYLTNL